jgi:hypothetical protein
MGYSPHGSLSLIISTCLLRIDVPPPHFRITTPCPATCDRPLNTSICSHWKLLTRCLYISQASRPKAALCGLRHFGSIAYRYAWPTSYNKAICTRQRPLPRYDSFQATNTIPRTLSPLGTTTTATTTAMLCAVKSMAIRCDPVRCLACENRQVCTPSNKPHPQKLVCGEARGDMNSAELLGF